MGHFYDESHGVPLEEHVKILETADLLDFWEQSQYLEKYLANDDSLPTGPVVTQYEWVILRELQFRSNMRDMDPIVVPVKA